MEIASNAAEHSKASDNGAFFSAQAWRAQRRELQIVVVDDGCGIPATLRGFGYQNDCDAIRAAIESTEVSGRRDAAGNPMGGGLGLPYVADTATKMMVRSGSCLATGYHKAGGTRLATTAVRPVQGTLVVADVAIGD